MVISDWMCYSPVLSCPSSAPLSPSDPMSFPPFTPLARTCAAEEGADGGGDAEVEGGHVEAHVVHRVIHSQPSPDLRANGGRMGMENGA